LIAAGRHVISPYPFDPSNATLALIYVAVFLAVWLIHQVHCLCWKAWARERGFAPQQLRLFSFGSGYFWKAWAVLAAGLCLIFALNNVLTSSPGSGGPRQGSQIGGYLPTEPDYYVGRKYSAVSPTGDSIFITSVMLTNGQMTVKGHYNLTSHDKAALGLYITGPTPRASEDATQQMTISKGEGDFELVHSHLVQGMPHVSMYAGGQSFVTLNFGKPATLIW
jgi:hypothetical protein